MRKSFICVFLIIVSSVCYAQWSPVEGKLMTRWAEDVSAEKPLPEYPRPSMVREDWKNLNGLWDYSIIPRTAGQPKEFDGKILVPFAIESALSGVSKNVGTENRLWYRRTFEIPSQWSDERIMLHFGASDWESEIWVNGQYIGSHRGGYDPFTFDITTALNDSDRQEIVVAVWDPTDDRCQPRGKQVNKPEGIWYTSVTGIWQTVWLEPIPKKASIRDLKITPDIDNNRVNIEVDTAGDTSEFSIKTTASGQEFTGSAESSDGSASISIPDARLWSPDNPFLYDLTIQLIKGNELIDEVESYFGMRKIELRKDEEGINRLFLNNEPLFQYGLLDQGWWPGGLYTAPTDEALKYDIEVTKELGFNMLRKHVKTEPQRFYYWCDKLGVLVWQDMPNGDEHILWNEADINRTPQSANIFEQEYESMIDSFYNHPSIVVWVPFNEGWGQFDTERITGWTQELDSTRLVINASGWADRNIGDIHDIHQYPGPAMPTLEDDRAVVLGEFGGLGLPLSGHTWQDEAMWGYRSYKTVDELTEAYKKLIQKLQYLKGEGLAAAIYTQTTDVETEVNGMMTYDRDVIKMDSKTISEINRKLYDSPPEVDVLLPDARYGSFEWKYTLDKPQFLWVLPDFNDRTWQTGVGGFGTEGTRGSIVGTNWDTSDIWLRRKFEVDKSDFGAVLLSIHHNDDAIVYINGAQAVNLSGYVNGYNVHYISSAAENALRDGTNVITVHCKSNNPGGEKFIDVGLLNVKTENETAYYVNPVIDHLADPAVLRYKDKYYLYPTGGSVDGYCVYTSPDLVNWQKGPTVYDERSGVMAPDVWKDPDSGKFYLYWTTGDQKIGVAVSDNPLGQFKDVGQLVDRAIDAHMFRDDNGNLYLYYVKFPGFKITVQPMKNAIEPQGHPKVILQPESEWEKRYDKVTEAPWVLKHNQKYYLLYSGTHTKSPHYAIGYAVADNPEGPFKRAPNNPVVHRDKGVFGPGHCSVVKDGNEKMWLVYHQKRNADLNYDRFICIDPIWFDKDGLLHSSISRGSTEPAPAHVN